DSDPRQEEIDVVSITNDALPPSVENDDSDGEVDAVDVLRVDNFIQNSDHEYFESEDSDFDNPPVPLPPPEPPYKEFDFANEILVVRSVVTPLFVKKTLDYKFLDDRDWEHFAVSKKLRVFLEKSAKAKASANQNKYPARVGRSVYIGKEDQWEEDMAELIKEYPDLEG
nr:hypothetical protein [Tanacetum cinerariifolium]